MTDHPADPTGRDRRVLPVIPIAIAVLVGAVVGAFVFAQTGPSVSIHTAVPMSAEGAISIEADGWTYGVPLDGVRWTDSTNTSHGSGRPDCLPPNGTTLPVTFAATEVTLDDTTWRPVLWVDCR